ncbi:hypothetical protein [Azospirillum argentinense]
MSLLPTPRQFAVDANGAPLAGATLAFYETGTTTPKAVYADVGLSTPHQNPVVADAAGLWPAIYLGPGTYKLEMKDADGVTVWTQDAVESSSASIGTKVVTSIAALRLIRPGPASDVGQVEVLGYHQAGDGGGGLFSWDGSSSADDGGIIIAPSVGEGPGRWRRVLAQTIDATWFGVAPANTAAANTTAVNAAIAAAACGSTIVISGGDFALDEADVNLDGKSVRLLLDGATINGSFPVAIKAIVDGQFEGGRRVVRSAGAGPTDFADHFSFRRADYADGSESYVNALRRHQTEVGPDAASSEWVGVYVLDNRSPHGQNIALMTQGHKRPGAGHTWTLHAEHLDYQSDPTTASVIAEVGFRGNGGDAHGNRVLWDLNYAKNPSGDGSTPDIAWGLRIGPAYGDASNGRLGKALWVGGDTGTVLHGAGTSSNTVDSAFARDVGEREFGLDLAGATYRSGVAYRQKAGDLLALEETDAVGWSWNASTFRAEMLNGTAVPFAVGAAGIALTDPGGFYPDRDPAVKLHKLRDRLFLGASTVATGTYSTGTVHAPTWRNAAGTSGGPAWAETSGQLVVTATIGNAAIVGASRASDYPSWANSTYAAPIGVVGAVLNDKPGSLGWASYLEAVLSPEAGTGSVYASEIAVKNQYGNRTRRPYRTDTWEASGAHGLWFAGGGDASYGGAPTASSNTAIIIGKNSAQWNRGIVFDADGIGGTDGVTGTGVAIEMAKGHQVAWATPTDERGAAVWSTVNAYAQRVEVRFDNGAAVLAFAGSDRVTITSTGVGVGRSPGYAFDGTAAQAAAYTSTSSSADSPAPAVNRASTLLENTSVGPAFMVLSVKSSNTVQQKAFIGAVPNVNGYGPDVVIGRRNASTGYTEDLRIQNDGAVLHRAAATTIVDASSHIGFRPYTVATLPSASSANRGIMVSDRNCRLATSDGTNWRFQDGTVVS